MNITSHNNLPITTGFDRPRQQRGASAEQQRKQPANNSLQSQIVQSQFNATSNVAGTQRIRPTVSAQAMSDQNLTHRGAQAKDVYQGIELTSDAELMPRLNVVA